MKKQNMLTLNIGPEARPNKPIFVLIANQLGKTHGRDDGKDQTRYLRSPYTLSYLLNRSVPNRNVRSNLEKKLGHKILNMSGRLGTLESIAKLSWENLQETCSEILKPKELRSLGMLLGHSDAKKAMDDDDEGKR